MFRLFRSQTGLDPALPPLPPHGGPWASVVLINYNGRAFIQRCLESLLASDYPWFDVILVDNGSTDDSMRLIAHLAGRMTILRNRRNELSARGLNRGIRLARGEIVVLLDLDTEVRTDWLRRLLAPLARDPRAAITGSKLLYPDGVTLQHAGGYWEGNAMCRHDGLGERDQGQWDRTREVPYVTGATMAIRREFLDQIGGRLEELYPFYYEDTDICWHARRLGWRVIYAADSVAIHYESASMGRGTPRYLFHYHRSRCRFLLKNFPWLSLLGPVPLRELSWFCSVAGAHGLWWILPLAWLHALLGLPLALTRRLERRRIVRQFTTHN